MDVFHGVLQKANRMDKAGVALIVRAVVITAVFSILMAVTGSGVHCRQRHAGGVGPGPHRPRVALDQALRGLVPPAAAGGWRRAAELVRHCVPLLAANLAYSAIIFMSRNSVGDIWGPGVLELLRGDLGTPLARSVNRFVALHAFHGAPRRVQAVRPGSAPHDVGRAAHGGDSGPDRDRLRAPALGWSAPILALVFGSSILDHMDLLIPVAASVSLTALVGFGNAVLTSVRRV